jgi:hypothetical protein
LFAAGLLVMAGCGSEEPALTAQKPLTAAAQAGAPAPSTITPTSNATGAASPVTGVLPAPAASAAAAPTSPIITPAAPPAATPPVGATPPLPAAQTKAPSPLDSAPMAMPTPAGSSEPVIPKVAGECPKLDSGTITYMGLNGIQIVSGTKPAAATAPMVFYWHGTGSFAGEFASLAGAVQKGVSEDGGILVSFGGSTGGDQLSGTNVFGKGDFEIVDQLVACGVANRNIDPKRIYATGCSAGALFATAQAAMRSSYMAAVAPNSGGFTVPVQFANMWTPALMTIHGKPGSDVVIVDFSNTSKTADDAFKKRGGFVVNCNHGGGHCAGGPLAGEMWQFFKAHTYGMSPSPWKEALPSGFSSQCKLY